MVPPLPLIYDLDYPQLAAKITAWGEPEYRARQIWRCLYANYWNNPTDSRQFTNLPSIFRQRLSAEFSFKALSPTKSIESADKSTIKILFTLKDGTAIETVLMRYNQRRTLCISTQVGCAMDCVFCATGQMGYKRNLSSGEIVEQVLFFARKLADLNERVTNVVIMGMGEPFHNYDATLAAIDRLNQSNGFNLGARHFTISTVGLVPKIRQFADEMRQINLAISLHAASDPERQKLIPISKKYPLSQLIQASHYYVEKTHRRITFEWALIQGVNDSVEEARRLAQLLKGLLCHVNIIPLNPTREYSGQATTRESVESFRSELEKAGIPCTVRLRRGIEIQAGCGQLASNQ